MSLPLIEPLESRIAPASLISISNVLAAESDSSTTFTFTVKLNAASTGPVTVDYATADHTAVHGTDYSSVSGTLTFDPGETSKSISVTVNGNDVADADRDFYVNLSNVTGDAAFSNSQSTLQAKGTIADDDIGIHISSPSITEGDSGTKTASVSVTLDRASLLPINVAYATADGTATAGSDYTSKTGTLTIAAGQTSGTIGVSITGDTVKESNETFTVSLSAPNGTAVNGELPANPATVTITDNDPKPTMTISDVVKAEGKSGLTDFVFTVSLSNAIQDEAVQVHWTTVTGTANENDFIAASGDLVIPAGSKTGTVTISVYGNPTAESAEDFFVKLSQTDTSTTNFTIADSQGHAVILDDPRGLMYTDTDGDTVTVKSSKPIFTTDVLFNNLIHFQDSTTTTGVQLTKMDLRFAPKTSIDVSTQKAGSGNGTADIGYLYAGSMGNFSLDGDLGGMTLSSARHIEVGSLGVHVTQNQGSTTSEVDALKQLIVHGNVENISLTLPALTDFSSLGLLQVDGNLVGSSTDGSGFIRGEHINTVLIKGEIQGGSGAHSGVLAVDSIGSATIHGGIVGGTGARSGRLEANSVGYLQSGDVEGGDGFYSGGIRIAEALGGGIIGNVIGSTGEGSGRVELHQSGDLTVGNGPIAIQGDAVGSGTLVIESGSMKNLTIGGDIRGGDSTLSGEVILTTKIKNLTVDGSVVGGAGRKSGVLDSNLAVKNLEIHGNIEGGTGNLSGVVGNVTSTFSDIPGATSADSRIDHMLVTGGIFGGDNASDTDELGFVGAVFSGHLGTVEITGSVQAGSTMGGKLTNSGVIRSQYEIGSVTIGGDLIGSHTTAAIISAMGQQHVGNKAKVDLAIGSITVNGSIQDAEILAGYNFDPNPGPRGKLVNVDASIGTVTTVDLIRSNIVAGVYPGDKTDPSDTSEPEPLFGNGDDTVASGIGIRDNSHLVSQISSVIVSGSARGTDANDEQSYAITAQWVKNVSVDGKVVTLLAGARNDTAPDLTKPISDTPGTLSDISDGFDFHVVEVA